MKMQELQRFASEGRMIPSASIQGSETISISAPIARVWGIQIDVDHWASWYAYLRNAKLGGPFGPGAKLSYGGFPKHNLIIAKVDHPRLVMIYGTYMGFSAVTRWDFNPLSHTQTQVTFSESSVGFLLSVLYSNHKLNEHLARWLEKLKAQSES